ncbi:calcium-translocating P-type ATPase, PMCA-type [Clostridium minihomine]|uniref:calcium-translocating P-type ATPase, PMCA-type n=1 Tax=Clostridium minihomine TaxID=2045012 RepID=UPI000C77A81E|nr:calcium-translocating P-type ATPase, PMCA-type [Clostridium minihomine]
MNWHAEALEKIQETLRTDFKLGLTTAEAEARLEKHGLNKLKEKLPRTFFQRFMDQMKDVMIIILLIAALISVVLSVYNTMHGLEPEWIEPIVIILIVVLNGVLGVVQESKAEAALEALKNMTAPNAKVLRDGTVQHIPSCHLVPGDIVELEAGDFVPADCRLIRSSSLKCDEAALTGESVPADKLVTNEVKGDAPLGDRFNMVYSGCAVSYGNARTVVIGTGMETEMGKIAALLDEEEDGMTPLQIKLAQLGKYLGFLALGICAVIFVIGLIDGLDILEMFMTAVSLAVAAIPEGLPAIVTIVLAIGVQRMVAKNAIIRQLPAVETLGSTSVICSDKTGTLTQNRMTLVKAYTEKQGIVPLDSDLSAETLSLLRLGTLCTDGTVRVEEDGTEKHLGDPTETAIVACALRNGIHKKDLEQTAPRIGEVPFDSDRKLMTTVVRMDEKIVVIVKGAPDILFGRCVTGDVEAATRANEQMGQDALRVLAIGSKILTEEPKEYTAAELEQGLTLVGLVGMIDPPRQEVKGSIAECYQAGIQTIMITGDHVVTASAIARDLGILREGEKAVTGTELQAMSDEELAANIEKYKVYARVTPSDKIRIVKAWQDHGQVVAMTGDGVNDAPALKAADIGCAMGITGTDVAKGAAAMTLTDDNFATIVTAVKEGRGIYDNIRKAVQFLLSCNLGEVLTVFVAMLLWKESPLMPIQLLWINLVTDSLPALALGVEPVEFDVMERKPRAKSESIFANGVGILSVCQGLIIGTVTLIAYYVGSRVMTTPGEINILLGESMAFATLAISQLVHAFNIRSSHSLFRVGFHTNKHMIGAFFASLSLMLVVLLVPSINDIFQVDHMHMDAWGWVIGLSLVPLVAMEIYKNITSLFSNKKSA